MKHLISIICCFSLRNVKYMFCQCEKSHFNNGWNALRNVKYIFCQRETSHFNNLPVWNISFADLMLSPITSCYPIIFFSELVQILLTNLTPLYSIWWHTRLLYTYVRQQSQVRIRHWRWAMNIVANWWRIGKSCNTTQFTHAQCTVLNIQYEENCFISFLQ